MSYDKETQALRRHMDNVHIAKQQKIYKEYNHHLFKVGGKFRKKKAMNCGNARCMFCTNPRRLWGHITLKELSSEKDFKMQVFDETNNEPLN